ncbi:RNAse P Rpr2/Rpp21/SNM1 subunit domain-containing protein [Tricharina praecox]|uniref:RNAse P Rpr2/Rpp21/SNM1 subunit domain-containing protein n=1 Tax=Tricharina praecox TaxID=43433 RepID=UPI00221E8632|nr:RNAse P Rpr2/Rpp21/SNM1 subunit domain-containing protein [Tricharina praecox]KAI5855894.1 RNAse P Rpr2/Rpp21/SNM1 subunit domain-containing protein [Tricharina praecox]
MGKTAKPKPAPNPMTTGPNAPLFARISHLYSASTLDPTSPLSRFYLSHARSIAKKSVLRLDSKTKRTICKRCDALLVPDVTCTHRVENQSKGGRKKWADVLVVECQCGMVKRFPVGMEELRVKRGGSLHKEKEEAVMEGKEDTTVAVASGQEKGGKKDAKAGKKAGAKKGANMDARTFKGQAIWTIQDLLEGKDPVPVEEEKQVSDCPTDARDTHMEDAPTVIMRESQINT